MAQKTEQVAVSGKGAKGTDEIVELAKRHIAGGVVSLNRKVNPSRVFVRAKGSTLWDADGRTYIDYHAAFAPFLLGHNCDEVNDAVIQAVRDDWSLMGSGTTPWEADLSRDLCQAVPSLDLVQIANTGSEATAHAIRLSRAWTGRTDIVLIMGGYNGWHNDVSRAVMPSLAEMGPRVSPGEYKFLPSSAGVPAATQRSVHLINFNDLESLEYVFRRYDIACVLLEPALQNIGVILPREGYLRGVKEMCERYGALCVFDEVKTGFRTALGGFQEKAGIKPDLSVFGKAVANGYPLGVVGGRADVMKLFDDPDPARRVLIAGTYNAHPFNSAAAIATLKFIRDHNVHQVLEKRSSRFYAELRKIFAEAGIVSTLVSNASAFCLYFMDHAPVDWHDILHGHNFELDRKYRGLLIDRGIYHIPLPCKQGSISFAHSDADLDKTLDVTRDVVKLL